MKRISGHVVLFLLMNLFGFSEAEGQIPYSKDFIQKQSDPYYDRQCKSFFLALPTNSEIDFFTAVKIQLEKINPALNADFVELKLLHDISSPGGRHLTLEQFFDGMPVFHSQIKVNLDKSNRIKSVFDNSWDVTGWSKVDVTAAFSALNLSAIETHFRQPHSTGEHDVHSRKVIAVIDDQPVALAEIDLYDNKTNEHFLLLADNLFNIYLRRDLNTYSAETATAFVHVPDPLTSGQVTYGSPYVDNDDSDAPELTAQRIQVTIPVTFDNSIYSLQNQYVWITEFSAPDVTPVTSSTPVFDFTRGQSGFEDVNVYYHLTQYHDYVESLGFGNLCNTQIWADAHALNESDNSMFTPHVLGPRLFFGTGGVDDAEDADVIVHEYGHSLSAAASPNSNVGHERSAVDEGLCDYLATSYSRDISEFRWDEMFTWDGHNEYWNGRTAVTTKVYPNDLTTSIHANGEIYNAALMKIWEGIGREKSDKILLQSLYGLAANMSMKDAAMLLYDADTALYNGEDFCVIYHALVSKGLTDTFPGAGNACKKIDENIIVRTGDDQTICLRDSIMIGDATTFNSNYSYSWSPMDGLGSPLSLVTAASPISNSAYILTASHFSGAYNMDTIVLAVVQCDIFLSNTEGFKYGEDLLIMFPDNSNNNSVEVFDVLGKRIYCITELTEQAYTFSGSLLPAGGYVFRMKADGSKLTEKVVKVR